MLKTVSFVTNQIILLKSALINLKLIVLKDNKFNHLNSDSDLNLKN